MTDAAAPPQPTVSPLRKWTVARTTQADIEVCADVMQITQSGALAFFRYTGSGLAMEVTVMFADGQWADVRLEP